MKTLILNSKSGLQDIHNYGIELLKELQHENEVITYDTVEPDFSNVPELKDQDEKLVIFNGFAFPNGFAAFTNHAKTFSNVKYLLSQYSSYEGLNLEVLKELGIRYRNNGGANANSVAQYAIMSMFMLLSKFSVLAKTKEAPTGEILGEEFHTKTVGIIGMGNVGQEIGRITQNLGLNTVYYNRSEKESTIPLVSFEQIFEQDIIFIAIATNSETKTLMSHLPDLLKEKHYLIDVSAAEDLYPKQVVVDLLNQNKIRGFALEVFDTNTFWPQSDKNLVITPHIAWCTVDAEKRTVKNLLERALKIVRSQEAEVDFIV